MSEQIPETMPTEASPTEIRPAKVRQPRKISPFWLLPLVAFIIGGLLFFQILKEKGEEITIRFQDGAGITAGKTTIRYQGLQIGLVKKVTFADGLKEVEVSAEINPEAKSVLKSETKFWLVRPTASLAGISGLDALVSGNYITLLPGEGSSEDEFIAENEPPLVPLNEGDLMVKLIADDLGSIAVGASVYFRKVPVGTVADYRFTPDQKKVEIELVINKKYAHLVKQASHFWNISGIKADANFASGLTLQIDSLLSVVQGAVAFDSPDDSPVAEQGQPFHLYADLKAAKRGIQVEVRLPALANVQANETGVFYQGRQIGVLAQLADPSKLDEQSRDEQKSSRQGWLLIDPSYQSLLRSGTTLLLKQPKFSLNNPQIRQLGDVLRGNYLELIAGEGEPSQQFVVQSDEDFRLNRPNTAVFTLFAPQAYGVDQGQGIYYHDVQIGEILKRDLTIENVSFKAIVYPEYRQLLGQHSQFVAISQLDVSVGLDGMRVNAGSPTSWLQGGIRLLDGKASGQILAKYPLYKDVESAESGWLGGEKQPTFSLSAQELSGIDKGSVLLYRKFPVGEVLAVRPQKSRFDVDIFVAPKYRHLISEQSRFWIEPALKVDLSAQGLSVQADPLLRTLKGAISFDNNGAKNNRILHASFDKARSGNTYLTLIANDASKLAQGMPIKYIGLTVGRVETLKLDAAKKQVKLTAFIDGQYFNTVAKSGSQFKAISPEISTAGVKNIEAALQNYIQVEAGSGEKQTQFTLAESDSTASTYRGGLPIILETSDANGITADAPVLYRGMQVGIVKQLSLSELGDRVLIYLQISPKYRHLVRKNSEFWTASGYTMELSLSGASINSGTMSQLLNGGIAFSTPSGKVVQPPAEANRRFRLQRKTPEQAQGWDQGAAE